MCMRSPFRWNEPEGPRSSSTPATHDPRRAICNFFTFRIRKKMLLKSSFRLYYYCVDRYFFIIFQRVLLFMIRFPVGN